MTEHEVTLLFFDDYFKKLKLDYMIMGSLLLGIIRNGQMIPDDREIDLCCQYTDVNEELLNTFKKDNYFRQINEGSEKYTEIYLSRNDSLGEPFGWVALSPLWLKNGICYLNPVRDECLVWNSKYYDKNNWSTIKYLGREFKAPNNPEGYLEYWYGSDWRIPIPFTWTMNKNRKKYSELFKEEKT